MAPGTHRQKIDVSTLPPGVYFVEIQSAHTAKAAGKFVKT
ncbi:MAG: T9SS type A sorting domain-containing protein [Lewinellaceae bacterium]|nr:T9SS type A sorting domain-containing protein [Lewinellaceae bacterium]